ncbi:membrane lipoprotein lipid attachment site-containing protein [Fibrella forsythiae]|uniref:Type IV secretion system putative lipoprotein virB7 n=1 Tax=Fibrella forsythiae TaxID=2817061 RepID=A0ABS3JDV9_9BACT|nr:membrane lipoprotein lipid attachment site-containing protein [Fibrella forsythiae]MBO0948168.1 membrane lipoprotein lipid attachment site-containing protein [Fibrella forsythiae]
MKRFLLFLSLAAVLAACQQRTTPLTPGYEGQYALQLSSNFNFDNTPVSGRSTQKGTLMVVKSADGIYTFTEDFPDAKIKRSYKAIVTGATFDVPVLTEPLAVNGVNYDTQYMGSGEFKTNSVTITRTTTFTAGSVRVSGRVTTYCYR